MYQVDWNALARFTCSSGRLIPVYGRRRASPIHYDALARDFFHGQMTFLKNAAMKRSIERLARWRWARADPGYRESQFRD